MAKSWRDAVTKFDEKKANDWLSKHSGKKIDPNMRMNARYIPNIETTKLPKEQFRSGHLNLRILPGLTTNPHPSWIFTVQEYYLRDFRDVLRKSDIPAERLEVLKDRIHSPASLDPEKQKEDPLDALRRSLYEEGSESSRLWAKKLFTKPRHFINVIARAIILLDDRDKDVYCKNVGPRVLRLPQDPVEVIMMAFKDPEIGDPTDLDEAFDFKYWMERKKMTLEHSGKEVWMPQYDHCEFSRKLTRAGTDEELEQWMTNLPNLLEEYVETPMKELEMIADLCEAVAFGRIKVIHPVGGGEDKDRPDDETKSNSNDDDVEPIEPRSRRSSEPEPEDEAPRSRRSSEPEPEDEAPRSRRRSQPEEDDEAPRSRRSSEPEPEDEAPRSRRRSEPEEEDEAPRSRRRSEPEPEDEAPRSRRRSEPEEEEEPKKRSRARVSDDDGDDDSGDWLDKRLTGMQGKKGE